MDRIQQKPIGTGSCGTKVQPGPCSLIKPGPGFAQQLPTRGPAPGVPAVGLKKQCELNPTQAASVKREITDRLLPDQPKPVSTPTTLVSISRPRPTALGTKLAPKTARISKEIQLIPVCIPGPQSANVSPHSPTESTLPQSATPSPQSPQSVSSQPYLSPTSNLTPKPSLGGSEQVWTTSPGGSTPGDKSGENNDFR